IKTAQVAADKEKAAKNQAKEAVREQNQKDKEEALTKTGESLVLEDAEIRLPKKDELVRQLDYHRNAESALEIPDGARIPCKLNIRTNAMHIEYLLAAATRYKAR
ncbi:hypothetical protein DFP72DRAFT_766798, partial [Ephemerocybe angulata]